MYSSLCMCVEVVGGICLVAFRLTPGVLGGVYTMIYGAFTISALSLALAFTPHTAPESKPKPKPPQPFIKAASHKAVDVDHSAGIKISVTSELDLLDLEAPVSVTSFRRTTATSGGEESDDDLLDDYGVPEVSLANSVRHSAIFNSMRIENLAGKLTPNLSSHMSHSSPAADRHATSSKQSSFKKAFSGSQRQLSTNSANDKFHKLGSRCSIEIPREGLEADELEAPVGAVISDKMKARLSIPSMAKVVEEKGCDSGPATVSEEIESNTQRIDDALRTPTSSQLSARYAQSRRESMDRRKLKKMISKMYRKEVEAETRAKEEQLATGDVTSRSVVSDRDEPTVLWRTAPMPKAE